MFHSLPVFCRRLCRSTLSQRCLKTTCAQSIQEGCEPTSLSSTWLVANAVGVPGISTQEEIGVVLLRERALLPNREGVASGVGVLGWEEAHGLFWVGEAGGTEARRRLI